MKKTIVLLIAALGLAVAAYAQPKALGLRSGYGRFFGAEASYEHIVGPGENFIEADLGVFGQGFKATGTYNFVFAQPAWTSRGDWAWYAGPGAVLGYVPYYYNPDPPHRYDNVFMFGIVGQIGLEYTFWFPLQLAVDVRPVLAIADGRIYEDGVYGFFPTLAVRYHF